MIILRDSSYCGLGTMIASLTTAILRGVNVPASVCTDFDHAWVVISSKDGLLYCDPTNVDYDILISIHDSIMNPDREHFSLFSSKEKPSDIFLLNPFVDYIASGDYDFPPSCMAIDSSLNETPDNRDSFVTNAFAMLKIIYLVYLVM